MIKYKISYHIGMTLSLLVGLWHFFVPWMFQWYSYIPRQYENLIVGINWTNLCFSLFLFGLSSLLLIWNRKIFTGSQEGLVLYGFMTFVWIFRVLLAIIEPWPLKPIAWAAYAQFAGAMLIAILLLIPFLKLVSIQRRKS